MKEKYIIIGISIIFLTSFLTILINTKNKEYIMQDGIMLALTLDGEKIKSYPEGTNYGVNVDCENGKGKWLVEEWKLTVEEVTGNVVCNIEFTSNTTTLISEVESKANTNANGYRYSGTNPNNYVWFNNEMWRIIGSIPTCLSASCGSNTTNLVKIIRNDLIGGVAYDANSSSYTGAWGSNTLYTLLNNYYYGSLDGTNTSYCKGMQGNTKLHCDYSVTGITPKSYYGKMVKNVYWNTGASTNGVNVITTYTNEISTRTVSGYVGLMSASDYGYAASSNYHSTVIYNFANSDAITLTDWLFSYGDEWTNIQSSNNSAQALSVYGTGLLLNVYAYDVAPFRPVVYLDSSVYIVSGDGTQTNPYQIGM